MTHLVDIHTHRTLKESEIGICNLNFNNAVLNLKNNETTFFSTGIHPREVQKYSNQDISKLENLFNDNRLVAIGECGLDKTQHCHI
jgi:TatD DNase family protein